MATTERSCSAGNSTGELPPLLRQALETGVCMGLPGLSLSVIVQSGGSKISRKEDFDDGDGDATATSTSDTGCCTSGADGLCDVRSGKAMTTDHAFCVGSITKTFVAVVVLQLVEEGKLELDGGTVLDYLRSSPPEIRELVGRVPGSSTATIRHLLSHQSGIPTWEFVPAWIRAGRGRGILDETRIWDKHEPLSHLVSDEEHGRLTCQQPGDRFSYSNTNYTLLGLVIESVTGNDASDEIRRRILEPLQLKGAYLESFEAAQANPMPHHYHFATRAFRDTAGLAGCFEELPHHHPYLVETTRANLSCEWMAGGLVMSTFDLAKFGQALQQGRLLGPAMQREMFIYHAPASSIVGDDPLGGKGSELTEKYCLGIARAEWSTNTSSSKDAHRCDSTTTTTAMWNHGGLTLGFSSKLLWLEDKNRSRTGGGEPAVGDSAPDTVVFVAVASNSGWMHSEFAPETSPWELFLSRVLLPALHREYF